MNFNITLFKTFCMTFFVSLLVFNSHADTDPNSVTATENPYLSYWVRQLSAADELKQREAFAVLNMVCLSEDGYEKECANTIYPVMKNLLFKMDILANSEQPLDDIFYHNYGVAMAIVDSLRLKQDIQRGGNNSVANVY